MKRPMLISGIDMTLICALLVLIPESVVVILPVAVLVLLLCLIPRVRKFIIVPVICILTIITIISCYGFYTASIEPCIAYDNTVHNIEGKVISTPRISGNTATFTIKTLKTDSYNNTLKIEITLNNSDADFIQLYDIVSLKNTELYIPKGENGDYDFTSASDGALLEGFTQDFTYIKQATPTPYYYCLKAREIVFLKINSVFKDDNASLLNGMLFGAKDDLPVGIADDFRACGIAHLLAVSGLHTSLWCGILLAILKLLKLKERTRTIVCLIFLACFIIISAFTPSVIRASVMMAVIIVAPLFNRQSDSLNSLGVAVTVLLLINPYTVQNLSFQLSALATLGVIASMPVLEKFTRATSKISIRQLRAIANTIGSGLLVSFFATLFTIPVSAYYFGVVSIMSPVANVLCVNIAFYSIIVSIVGLVFLFIPVTFSNTIGLVTVSIAQFLMDIVKSIAEKIASLPYCTIPTYKTWLIGGLFILLVTLLTGYALYKVRKKSKGFIAATAVASLIVIIAVIIVPLAVPPYKNTITIIPSGNNTNLIIRSGTDYAYICNTSDELPDNISSYLPRATSEKLCFFISPYMSPTAYRDLEYVAKIYTPDEIRLSEYTFNTLPLSGLSLPENAIKEATGKYTLSEEISFEIIDTLSVKYAIIKGSEKTVFVHLYGDTFFSDETELEGCDVLVLNGAPATLLTSNIEQIIINADTSIINHPDLEYNRAKCNSLHVTATDGITQIII